MINLQKIIIKISRIALPALQFLAFTEHLIVESQIKKLDEYVKTWKLHKEAIKTKIILCLNWWSSLIAFHID